MSGKVTCEYGDRCTWTGAVEPVRYPDGSVLRCCDECAKVARQEVAHLRREAWLRGENGRTHIGRLVEWPSGSGRYAVSALIEHGPDMGREIWFSLTQHGSWYVDDGHLGYDDRRSLRRFADGCRLSLREARKLLTGKVVTDAR